jgi:hypothetical protein
MRSRCRRWCLKAETQRASHRERRRGKGPGRNTTAASAASRPCLPCSPPCPSCLCSSCPSHLCLGRQGLYAAPRYRPARHVGEKDTSPFQADFSLKRVRTRDARGRVRTRHICSALTALRMSPSAEATTPLSASSLIECPAAPTIRTSAFLRSVGAVRFTFMTPEPGKSHTLCSQRADFPSPRVLSECTSTQTALELRARCPSADIRLWRWSGP